MRLGFRQPFRRAAVARNLLLGVVAAALLGVAAWRLIWHSGDEDAAPSDAASAAGFVCEGCGEFFTLTGREQEELDKSRHVGAGPKSDPTGGRAVWVACKKCGKASVRGEKCPQHGDVIKLFPAAGDAAKCSKCEFRGG